MKANDVLTGTSEICEFLGIQSSATMLRFYREYDLPIEKRGNIWMGSKKKIEEWNQKQEKQKKDNG